MYTDTCTLFLKGANPVNKYCFTVSFRYRQLIQFRYAAYKIQLHKAKENVMI